MKNKSIISLSIIVLTIFVFLLSASFAYFTASASGGNDVIRGSTYNFEVDLQLNILKKSTELVPIQNNNLIVALTGDNICIKGGYEVCSIYELVLTNSSEAINLYGYIVTGSSTYTTNNLKVALYTYDGTNYTLVTDIITLGHNPNTINNLNYNEQEYMITLANGLTIPTVQKYYLVTWISETNSDQSVDEDKYFNGSIVFESIYGDKITSSFN